MDKNKSIESIQFTEEEIEELINLFKNRDFEKYAFKIFERAKKFGNGKFDFIPDDFYFNTLAPIFATPLPIYPPKDDTLSSYKEMILSDWLSLSVLLDETYKSQK